jgi:bisphosphoglycerate-independent phosphoglycerate mutase (AlkP superfamily)
LKASEDEIGWVKKECSVENAKKVMSSLVASAQDTQPHTSLQYLLRLKDFIAPQPYFK